MNFLLIIICYLLGSIPTGLILGRFLNGADIRKQGSGNIGTTNAYRLGGKKLAALTLIGDMLKAIIPLSIIKVLHGEESDLLYYCSFASVLGHMYPIFLKFKGGKGVATTLAALLIVSPNLAFSAAVSFFVIFLVTRIASLASLIGVVTCLVSSLIYDNSAQSYLVASLGALIFLKHRDNIHRLVSKKEFKL